MFMPVYDCAEYLMHIYITIGEEGDDADLDAPKIYEPIPNFTLLKERLLSYQETYNETVRGAKMDMVFFKVCIFKFIL